MGCGWTARTRVAESQRSTAPKRVGFLVLVGVGSDAQAWHWARVWLPRGLVRLSASASVPPVQSYTWAAVGHWLRGQHFGWARSSFTSTGTAGLLSGPCSAARARTARSRMRTRLRERAALVIMKDRRRHYQAGALVAERLLGIVQAGAMHWRLGRG